MTTDQQFMTIWFVEDGRQDSPPPMSQSTFSFAPSEQEMIEDRCQEMARRFSPDYIFVDWRQATPEEAQTAEPWQSFFTERA